MPTFKKCIVVGILAAGAALAQVSGGAFRGEVRDASGAVVPQAEILIRSINNGMQMAAESSSVGLYITPNLIPGSYVLSALKAGFKTEVFGPVVLEVNQIVRVDFALALGTRAESVRVEAEPAQLLSMESAEISQVIAHLAHASH